MATQPEAFEVYDPAIPPGVTVVMAPGFRTETGQLYKGASKADKCHFLNVNVLIKRFSSGQSLSQGSLVRERDGYAFKSGTLRFYGAYSKRHNCFVLSHAILKRHAKLAEEDLRRMNACVAAFDAMTLPPDLQRALLK
jgi:hypothetical protein